MSDQNIEQLRAEAAMRRQAIATDLELVGDRVSPTRIAERQKAQLRQRVHGVRNSVFGTPDRHRGVGTAHRAYGSPTTEPIGWQDRDTGDAGGGSLGDRASGAVQTLKEAAPSSLGEATEGNPLGAAIVGFGIGMLAATLLPSSPDEQRAAQRIQGRLEEAGSAVGRTGKEAVEHVKPEAQHAVEDLKESAKESADALKSQVQSKADDVKQTAQAKTDEVRTQA
ncbi:MAG TPA: DUF3618 domain-containing protein [Acidimicrobiales bacterium]|nr:DUF3618 domain-containing protein [Acidimicrobiales bacterium]